MTKTDRIVVYMAPPPPLTLLKNKFESVQELCSIKNTRKLALVLPSYKEAASALFLFHLAECDSGY